MHIIAYRKGVKSGNTRNRVNAGNLTWAFDKYVATERGLDDILKKRAEAEVEAAKNK